MEQIVMKPEEFSKVLEKGDLGPLYYLYGEEGYLVERAAKAAVELLVQPDMRDFNLDLYYGAEAQGTEIVAAAQTLPMFARQRVVLVRMADKLSAASLDALIPYVLDPSPSTCLIMQGEKIDSRKKFFTEWKKKGQLVEYKKLYENQLLPFIRNEVIRLGKKIDPAAAEMLLFLSGNNLKELVSQIEKVSLHAGKSEKIAVSDVKAVVSDTRIDSVFELANSLGERNVEKALRSLLSLLEEGEAPLLLLAVLTRHFRQIWKVRELLEKKVPQSEIGTKAGVNPYFLQGIIRQARNYDIPSLRKAFESFFQLDLALKSTGTKPGILMERLVMELCM